MKNKIIKQVAALPYRVDECGKVEVMLITSRGGQRWIPPKGNLRRGVAPHDAAAQEAFEEAGVIGRISAKPIGTFRATKAQAEGAGISLDVTVFPLQVDRRTDDFPERGQRMVSWFQVGDAACVVREQGLADILSSFHPQPVQPHL